MSYWEGHSEGTPLIRILDRLKKRLAATLPDQPEGPTLPEGTTVDRRFVITRILGAGGTSSVYAARQLSMDREVALKILRSDLKSSGNARTRFLQEVGAVSRLTSPHTISVYDVGESDDGLLYVAMELLKGRSLYQFTVDHGGGLPVSVALRIVGQVLDSLEEAHEAGVLHRDIKPDNIFMLELTADTDFAKVLDFGIATLDGSPDSRKSDRGLVLGTPLYMSPEQMEGKNLDPRSDLYSLALVLFELLAGRPPFTETDPLALGLAKVRKRAPTLREINPDLKVPRELEMFIEKGLARDPDDRPATASEFRNLLLLAVDGEDARLPLSTPATQSAEKARTVSTRFRLDGKRFRATTSNLNSSGAFFFSKALPDPGQELEFAFNNPGSRSAVIHVMGEVVRVVREAAGPGEVRGFTVRWKFANRPSDTAATVPHGP